MKQEPTKSQMRSVIVTRYRSGEDVRVRDSVAAEDPLEIRLNGQPIAVTMRTPGHDEDLALGFLLSEGILLAPQEVRHFSTADDSHMSVLLQDGVEVDVQRFSRNMFVSSSCGVCGKASIESVKIVTRPIADFQLSRAVAAGLTEELRKHQPAFDATGGLHAAGLFGLSGDALAVREDVGRHNAVDKVIGAVAVKTWPLPPAVLVVSGRQSFEVVQKAAVVGIGGVIGVSAPSSLAVELAQTLGLLLVGFSRGGGFNVYAGERHLSP